MWKLLVIATVIFVSFGCDDKEKIDRELSTVKVFDNVTNMLRAMDGAVSDLDEVIEEANQERLDDIREDLLISITNDDFQTIVKTWNYLNIYWIETTPFPAPAKLAEVFLKVSHIPFFNELTGSDFPSTDEPFTDQPADGGLSQKMMHILDVSPPIHNTMEIYVPPAECGVSCTEDVYMYITQDMGLYALWNAAPIIGHKGNAFLTSSASGNLLERCSAATSEACDFAGSLKTLSDWGASSLWLTPDGQGLGTFMKLLSLIRTLAPDDGLISRVGRYRNECRAHQEQECSFTQSYDDL